MVATYQGRHPGKIWSAYTKVKAVTTAAFSDDMTGKYAKTFGKRIGYGLVGPAACTVAYAAVPLLMVFPIGPIAAIVGYGAAIGFGFGAWRAGRRMCNTSAVSTHVSKAERAWEESQKHGGMVGTAMRVAKIGACSVATLVGGTVATSAGYEQIAGEKTPEVFRVMNSDMSSSFKFAGAPATNKQLTIAGGAIAALGAAGTAACVIQNRRRRNAPKA